MIRSPWAATLSSGTRTSVSNRPRKPPRLITRYCLLSALLSTTRSMSPTSLSLAPTRSLSVRAETVICFMGVVGWAGAVADGWVSLVLGKAGAVALPAAGAAGVGAGLGAVEGAGVV